MKKLVKKTLGSESRRPYQHSIMRFATEEFARELLFGLIIRLEKTATENVSHWHQSGIFSVDV